MTHNRFATGGIRAGLRGSSLILLLIAAAMFATSCQGRHQAAPHKAHQPQTAPHKAAERSEGSVQFVRYDANFHVNADGSYVQTQTVEAKALTPKALSKLRHTSVIYDARFATAKVLYAYTLKKDHGGRVYAYISNGKSKTLSMFSDIRTITVKFPDLAVGDTIAFKYRLALTKPIVPGNFSLLASFSKFIGWDHTRVAMSAPASLRMKIETRDVKGGEIASKGGRNRWVWTYKNTHPAAPESSSVSSIDYGPLIAASTFKDYGAVAAAFATHAMAKAKPDAQIKELADRITRNAHTQRAQAAALYYWVVKNIRNPPNYGVVLASRRTPSVILKSRIGDSKDHSTLFGAMLAAKGIRSTSVLIHSGSLFHGTFTLPKVPATRIFNHVITYIPSLHLYADSTSRFTPFGKLPVTDADRPVIYITGYDGIRRTPPTNWKDNRMITKAVLTINSNGSASGETRFTMQGFFASLMRALMTSLPPDLKQQLVRRNLAADGYVGTGTANLGDPSKPSEVYHYSESFRVVDALDPSKPGAFTIKEIGGGNFIARTISGYVKERKPTVNYGCMGAYMKQLYTIHMPRNVRIVSIPSDVHLKAQHVIYSATYKRTGNTVTVARILNDTTSGNVCTPKESKGLKPLAIRVMKNLNAQIVYR